MVKVILDQIQAQLHVGKNLLELVVDQQKFLVQEQFDQFVELSKKKTGC
jgi:hypothetical protein